MTVGRALLGATGLINKRVDDFDFPTSDGSAAASSSVAVHAVPSAERPIPLERVCGISMVIEDKAT